MQTILTQVTDPLEGLHIAKLNILTIHSDKLIIMELFKDADHIFGRHPGEFCQFFTGQVQLEFFCFEYSSSKAQQQICQSSVRLAMDFW